MSEAFPAPEPVLSSVQEQSKMAMNSNTPQAVTANTNRWQKDVDALNAKYPDLTNAQVGSFSELKSKFPELYKALTEGMMTNFMGQMRQHNEEFKKIMKESETKR